MQIIKKNELQKLINFKDVFTKTKKAYELFSKGQTITPPFTVFTIPESKGSVHFKCGYVPGEKYFAMKYSGAFYGNKNLGISDFLGLFIVFNSKTGQVESIIDDEGYLTDYRTGVAGAIATQTLANPKSETIAMIGTGVQARMQLMALMQIMPIKNLNVWGRSSISTTKYIEEMQQLYPNLSIKSYTTPKEAVASADIVYTVTYSEQPLIKSEWLKKGTHITAIGACEPTMQELDPHILKLADIVCTDSIDACASNGELHHALDLGIITKSDVIELGQALSSKIKRNPDDITICDLVGIGFQDAVIASCVMSEYYKNRANGNDELS